MRRHHNDALERLQQQSDALLYALRYQKDKGDSDETAVDRVRHDVQCTHLWI